MTTQYGGEVEQEGSWALVPVGGCDERGVRLDGKYQVVNTATGSRSIVMAEESARRVWRALLAG